MKANHKNLTAIFLLILLASGAYFNSLPGEFIHDDVSEIVDNPYIKDSAYISKIFTSPAWAFEFSEERTGISNYYRPLQYLLYMGIYKLGGLNPFWYHLFKLLLHITTTILLFFLLKRHFTNFRTALVAGLLFAIHPIHTEAVTWISGITDALVTPFILLSFLFFLRYETARITINAYLTEGKNSKHRDNTSEMVLQVPNFQNRGRYRIYYILSLLFFLIGLFSKETAVILIPLIILYDLLFQRIFFRLKRIFTYLPYIAIFLIYLTFRINAIGSLKVAGCKYAELNRLQCLINPINLTASYFFKCLIPINQNGWYVFHPILTILDLRFILALLFLGALGSLAVFLALRKRKKELFFLLWFFISISPVIFFFRQIGLNVFAERYLYLPGVGFCTFLALELNQLNKKILFGTLLVVILGVSFSLTIRRNMVWSNRFAFWSATVSASPDSSLARNNLGVAYYHRDQFMEAETEYKQAIELMFENPTPHLNLALMHQKQGLYQQAIFECKTALLIRPDYADGYDSLGDIYMEMERYEDAISAYKNAVRIKPLNPSLLLKLGNALQEQGDFRKALANFKAALRLNPELFEAHLNSGSTYDRMGKYDEAIREFMQAKKLNPDIPEAYINLSLIYSKTGKTQDALKELQTAIKIKPDSAEAHYRLGVLYTDSVRFPEAVKEYWETIKLDNNHAQAHLGLGILMGMTERYQDSERLLKRAIEIQPDSIDAHYNLGVLYRKLGNRTKLLEVAKLLKQFDPKLAKELVE